MSRRNSFCDRVARRDFLRVGGTSLYGMSLTLPALIAQKAAAKEAAKSDVAGVGKTSAHKDKEDVSLIVVFLRGGLSTIDTFDMKPDAPAEMRGEFDPIASSVPGIHVGEHMPKTARHVDKFALVRSFTHNNSNHGFADHYMLTGYHPTPAFIRGLTPNNERPSHGSIISRKLGPRGPVPPYVCLPTMHKSGGAAYLGPSAEPFVIQADPNAPDFSVPDLVPPLDIDISRVSSRQNLLSQLGRFERSVEARANSGANTLNVFREKAFQLMTSDAAKEAFDVDQEPEKLREEYGRTTLGQSCLMARRLIEAGVRCVTIEHTGWDTHGHNFRVLKKELLPRLDAAMAGLYRDLDDRGMLDTTLVVVTGEFGRTPRINGNAGRDHWGPAFTVPIGGGGIRGGRVVGKTDAIASRPTDSPYGPEDLAATIHHLMGIDPEEEFHSAEGRPFKIVNDGSVMREML